jgi:hypothetical protein
VCVCVCVCVCAAKEGEQHHFETAITDFGWGFEVK